MAGLTRSWTPAASACLRREKSDDVIIRAAVEQVEIAIESANVIILVVNVQEGVVPLDREVAQRLRKSGKPVLVAVNKVDTAAAEKGMDEFARLGFEKIFPVSAIHGEGIEDLMDAATAHLPVQSPKVRSAKVLKMAKPPTANSATSSSLKTGHRRPPKCRQIFDHQRAHEIRARHCLADSRHHARRD